MDKLDYLTTESEKRVTNLARRVEILSYVAVRQRANQRTTKSEVIRHMKGLSSGETTHNIIKQLIKEGKLNVQIVNSQVHFLTVKENYSLPQFERELLVKAITDTHSHFKNIVRENAGLVEFLKQAINDDELRSMVKDSYIDIPFGDEYQIAFKAKKRRKIKSK
jgi:hypothetical protein